MFSIYTSFFNVQAGGFDWRATLLNWLEFLHDTGQISIAINTSTDDSPKLVRDWFAQWKLEHPMNRTAVEITETSIPYDDPLFDGKIKAAALEKCIQPFCVLLDCDEVLVPAQYGKWMRMAHDLQMDARVDAFLVPVVDLIGDADHYKSIGTKWYLHKNHPYLTRGVVNEARLEDGSLDTSKSDTCELISRETGALVRASAIMAPLPQWMTVAQLESGEIPFVYHLGWLNKAQRIKQSAFWRDVWTARRGGRDPEPEMTLEKLAEIPRFKHKLPRWSSAPVQAAKQQGDLWTRFR